MGKIIYTSWTRSKRKAQRERRELLKYGNPRSRTKVVSQVFKYGSLKRPKKIKEYRVVKYR